MSDILDKFLIAARLIVQAEKELYPGCDDAVNAGIGGGVGGQEGSVDTGFDRVGRTTVQKQYSLPTALASALSNLYYQTPITTGLSNSEIGYLQSMLSRDNTAVPGLSQLQSIGNLDPNTFRGSNELQNVINQDPYSQTYENETQDLYNRSFDKARAAAMSGPQNVRGATARQGFELAELDNMMSEGRFHDVNVNQQKQAGLVEQAVSIANAIDGARRGQQMGGIGQRQSAELERDNQSMNAAGSVGRNRLNNVANLQLASETLGGPQQYQAEDVTGKGFQNSSTMGWNVSGGVGCCFIFLEVLNGKLPPHVRFCRDLLVNPRRRTGYNLLAKQLVPLMRLSPVMMSFINAVLVSPLSRYGKALVGLSSASSRDYLVGKLVTKLWFTVFDTIGLVDELITKLYGKLLRHNR